MSEQKLRVVPGASGLWIDHMVRHGLKVPTVSPLFADELAIDVSGDERTIVTPDIVLAILEKLNAYGFILVEKDQVKNDEVDRGGMRLPRYSYSRRVRDSRERKRIWDDFARSIVTKP